MFNKQLREAKKNLKRIRKEYKNEPELLSFYEPTAKLLVDVLKSKRQL